MGQRVLYIFPTRDTYSKENAIEQSMTVGELKEKIYECWDDNAKVIFCNDGGYTYGYVTEESFRVKEEVEE